MNVSNIEELEGRVEESPINLLSFVEPLCNHSTTSE